MKNVNSILQSKLYNLLKDALSPIPIYNKNLPATINPSGYVVISDFSDFQKDSSMVTTNSDTVFILKIFTKDTSANSGVLCNSIATKIFDIIQPVTNALIDLEPDFQTVSLQKIGDQEYTLEGAGTALFINRFITYKMNIYHKQ